MPVTQVEVCEEAVDAGVIGTALGPHQRSAARLRDQPGHECGHGPVSETKGGAP